MHVFFDDRVERLFRELNNSISEGSLVVTITLKKLQLVVSRFTALTGLLVSLHLLDRPTLYLIGYYLS